jgi:hypothetical protein
MARPATRLARLAWFVGLYAASLGFFAAAVYGLRLLIPR